MTKKTLFMCMMGFVLLGIPTSSNAQGGVTKVLTKAGKAISKVSANGGSKVGSKAGTAVVAGEASAASKAGKTQLPAINGNNGKHGSNISKTRKQKRVKTYECPKCDGKGTIKKWDDYFGPYDSTCPRCLGLGYKYVRY